MCPGVPPAFLSGGHLVVTGLQGDHAMRPTDTSVKLTKRTVDQAEPRASRYELWDADLKGFGLRVGPSGKKSFIVRYRAGAGGRSAPKRFLSIGRFGALTPDEARKKARDILAAAA